MKTDSICHTGILKQHIKALQLNDADLNTYFGCPRFKQFASLLN